MFLPGIKGTELWCDRCARRAWPPAFIDNPVEFAARSARQKFSLRPERLMNDGEYECLRDHDKRPVAVIGTVKALRGLYTRDVYESFYERLRRVTADTGDVHLVAFPYDWTRSNVESANGLYNALKKTEGAYSDILLVAHSMGGLVCRYMLENVLRDDGCTAEERCIRDNLASKIALFYGIGVPHYGCVKSLHHLVNPEGDAFGHVCRDMPSIYEMISYGDIATQINAKVDLNILHRCRSDVFLHDGDGDIVVDPTFWRLNGDETSLYAAAMSSSSIVEMLTSEYPVLRDHVSKLYNGIDFHRSLNTDLKPSGCVYAFVNATGVLSPSAIDPRGRLQNECLQGDGVVCSVVSKRNKRTLKSLFRLRGDGTGVKLEQRPDKSTSRDHVYKNSVHVSMLNKVDLVTLIEGVVIARSHRRRWNVRSVVLDKIKNNDGYGVSRSRIPNCVRLVRIPLFTCYERKRQTDGVGSTASNVVSSEFDSTSANYRVKLVNTGANYCVISLHEADRSGRSVTTTENGIGVTLIVESTDAPGRFRRLADPKHLSIRISTREYGKTWNRLVILLSGHHRPVSFKEEITPT